MTQDEWPHSWRARIIELSKLLGAATSICATAVAVWLFIWGPIGEFIGLVRSTNAEVQLIWREMERLADGVARATGEDRIIREQPGQTYVPEPVYVGDTVQFNMVVERTTLGRPCILERTVPMYVDETRIPQPGPAYTPTLQVGSQATFVQPRYEMPTTLQPGRIAMHLILEYRCPASSSPDGVVVWERVLDRTSTAVFRLMEGARTEPQE
jgi:hypothetical protein